MAAVLLANVTKVFPPDICAVRDLSLEVADGELVVLVGPSGCGKTTTLRLIAGLEEPSAGSISIGGREVNQLAPRDRDVAMVFQKEALYPHLNVRSNLSFGIKLKQGMGWWKRLLPGRWQAQITKEADERVSAAARLLGLEKFLDRRPHQLSGGQQQRVALGRAIVRRPAVFLLDEPLSHLDSRLRTDMRRELHLLQRRLQATMIYVTHDPAEALALADRVVVLDQGIVQQADSPTGVYEQPANRMVAGLFASPTMNFVDGVLVLQNEGLTLCTSEGPLGRSHSVGWITYVGRPVTLGIRPEHVTLGDGHEPGLRMRVTLVESLGSGRLVTAQRSTLQLTARLDGSELIREGQDLDMNIDMEHGHLFDRITGQALPSKGPAG